MNNSGGSVYSRSDCGMNDTLGASESVEVFISSETKRLELIHSIKQHISCSRDRQIVQVRQTLHIMSCSCHWVSGVEDCVRKVVVCLTLSMIASLRELTSMSGEC